MALALYCGPVFKATGPIFQLPIGHLQAAPNTKLLPLFP